MKRRILLAIAGLLIFCAGFFAARGIVIFKAQQELNGLVWNLERIQSEVIMVDPLMIQASDDESLKAVDWSRGDASITLRIRNGLSRYDGSRVIRSDGSTLYDDGQGKRVEGKIDPEKCKQWFIKTLGGGVLHYSPEVVELKKSLRGGMIRVSDASYYDLEIVVPEIQLDRKISVYALPFEYEYFPEIVEYKILDGIFTDMAEFVKEP